MYKKMGLGLVSYIFLLGGVSGVAMAAEGPFPLHLSISEDVSHESNANRSSVELEELDEIQMTSSLNLNSRFDEYDKVLGSLAYRWSQTEYSEDSQPKEPVLTGNASLRFGGAADFYNIGLAHTSSQLLINPTASDVIANQENRNTLTSSLTLKTKATTPSQLALTVSQADVKYDELEQNNTQRLNSELNYSRRMTALNSGGVKLSYTDVSYTEFSTSDYDNTLLYVYFNRQLRFLNYYLAAGLNQSSSLSGDNSSPYAQLNIGYTSGASSLSFSASTELTDNSQGNNISRTASPSSPPTGEAEANGSLSTQDQIQRDSISLSYGHSALCARCSMRVQVTYENDDYLNTPNESSTDLLSSIGLSYRPTRSTTLGLNLRHSAFEYTQRPDADNYDQNSVRVNWSWQSKTSLSLSIFLEALERNNDGTGSYSGNSAGLGLSYQIM